MIPFAQLLVAPSSDAVRAEIVTALITVGIRADLWRKGGTASTLLTYVCKVFAGGMGLVTQALSGAFLTLAQGPWLVLLAYYVYGVIAQAATFAQGAWTLTNTSGAIYSKPAGSVTIQNPVTGVTYTNVNPFTIAAHSVLTGVIFQATVTGSAGNAGANQANVLVTSLLGVTVTNPGPVAGLDADSRATIIAKCLARLAARSPLGPKGAYRNAVFNAKNLAGNPVNINRVEIRNDPATGQVFVYCASPTGAPSPGDLIAAQAAVVLLAQPFGIMPQVVAATVVNVTNPVTIWARGAGITDPATIQAAAIADLDAYCAAYPIGGIAQAPSTQGYLYASLLDATASQADPLIFDVEGFTADIALTPNAVPVFTGPVTVRQVAS